MNKILLNIGGTAPVTFLEVIRIAARQAGSLARLLQFPCGKNPGTLMKALPSLQWTLPPRKLFFSYSMLQWESFQ